MSIFEITVEVKLKILLYSVAIKICKIIFNAIENIDINSWNNDNTRNKVYNIVNDININDRSRIISYKNN